MKYKKGDKVKIKFWPDIVPGAKQDVENLNTNCIVTIKEILEERKQYRMEEFKKTIWRWDEKNLELFSPEPIQLFSTNKRFELMDLD